MPVPGPRDSFGKMVRTAVEYDRVYNFLQLHRCPAECSKNKKRSLRRKANEHYKFKSGTFMYSAMSVTKAIEKKGCFSGRERKRVVKSEDERLSFDFETAEFVQILNLSGVHWITISTIGCSPGDINIIDSLLYQKEQRNKLLQ